MAARYPTRPRARRRSGYVRLTALLVVAVAAIAVPPVAVRVFARASGTPQPARQELLSEKVTPLLVQEIATTRVTLNSQKLFTYSEDKSWWEKYGPYLDVVLTRGLPVGVAANPPPVVLSDMKRGDKQVDAILYETVVSLDYGISADELRPDWIGERDGRLVVRLPTPKPLGIPKVELERSRRLDQQTNRSDPADAKYSGLDQAALDYAQKNAAAWAAKLRVDAVTKEKTRTALRSIIGRFNPRGLPVDIVFDGDNKEAGR